MALLPIATTGYNLISSAVSIFSSHPKDAGRLRSNATAYALAVGGNRGAAEYLKGRSGKFGSVKITVAVPQLDLQVGDTRGGWATAKTRNDAYNKYLAVADSYAGLGGGQGATQKVSGDIGLGQVREGNVGNVSPTLASIVPESITKYAPYILLGITVLWALKYAKKMR
jgi:hypothetical protein